MMEINKKLEPTFVEKMAISAARSPFTFDITLLYISSIAFGFIFSGQTVLGFILRVASMLATLILVRKLLEPVFEDYLLRENRLIDVYIKDFLESRKITEIAVSTRKGEQQSENKEL